MSRTPLAIHDELLENAPEYSVHDSGSCPFCKDWAMTESGIPSGFDRLDSSARNKPFGDVAYADPGFQSDGVNRFPIDTLSHAKRSWEYISRREIASEYSASDLSKIKAEIAKALESFGTKVSNESDAASEGGKKQMVTINKETHEALLEKHVRDAVAALEAEKAALVAEKASLEAKVADLTASEEAAKAEAASLKESNDKLSADLDTAQVAVKTAQDEVATLKADIASKEEAAQKAEIASKRAEQVRNLGLFSDEYVTEKASAWADMAEESWTERLEEWKSVKGATPGTPTPTTDSASALSGTREAASGKQTSARRAVLGLN